VSDKPYSVRGFLVHVFHQQRDDRFLILGIGRIEDGGTFGFVDDRYRPGFFVRQSDIDRSQPRLSDPSIVTVENTYRTMDGEAVVEIVSHRLGVLRKASDALAKDGIRTYEADVSPVRRFLMDRRIRQGIEVEGPSRKGDGVDRVYTNPELRAADVEVDIRVVALDIETLQDASSVLAFSLVSCAGYEPLEEAHVVGRSDPTDAPTTFAHDNEGALLDALSQRIEVLDPDILTGWNVVDFDLRVLEQRYRALGKAFNLGRTRDTAWRRRGQSWGGSRVIIPGRQAVDAMRLARAIPRRFDDYRLDTVARELLGRGKTLEPEDDTSMPDTILDAFDHDRAAFCEYCLEDSRLVRDILDAEGLIPLTIRRSALTGLSLDNAWGSIGAFEFLYITGLHSRGIVAPTLGTDAAERGGVPGGMIVPPQTGVHDHVFVFDFKSLYPSIIQTFNIDPLALHVIDDDPIEAPNGARFDRSPGILPDLLGQFFTSREEAKARGDELASYTYKIVMNSFYGVLATSACRFAAPELAGAITGFGHQILRWTQHWLEDAGAKVLYGDTDSVFVQPVLEKDVSESDARSVVNDLCLQANHALEQHLRKTYDIEPRLELEFEKYYRRLLLPPMRGNVDRGRAKGYAGLLLEEGRERIEIVGMEAVRRDWTDLSHNLQLDLFGMLFADAPNDEIEERIQKWIDEVRGGKHDADLVYRKGLRKDVEAYTKSSPPHVKAARLLKNPGGVIHYLMTREGPQPTSKVTSLIDYEHYVQKQIAPIASTVAQLRGIDLHAVLTGERNLFAGMEI